MLNGMLSSLEGTGVFVPIMRFNPQRRTPRHRQRNMSLRRDTTRHVNTISKRISHMPRSISATCFQKSQKTWLVNTISKRISHMPRSISATCFQKSPKTRLVNTISKRVSHMPRSISVTWKAKSAKIVLPIGVGESRKSYGSFFETKHATCLTLSRNRDADRECWPGLGLSKWTKKLLFRGKIDDRKADEGKWFNLDSTLKTFN